MTMATAPRQTRRQRATPAQPGARHARLVAEACRMIEESESAPDLAALASAAGLSRFHFHRLFRQVTGVTPKAYASAQRAARVQQALAHGTPVTAAIHDAGYASHSPFYAVAARDLGMRPADYRAGGRGSTIRFAVAQCRLGDLLVAASAKGICAILLGDDPQALVQDLQRRFTQAELVGADSEFEQWVARVVGFVDAPGSALDLPLDLRGTAFQRRVWEALRRIPPGSTVSYAELARRIGLPRATRAVAQACAANAVAVAVPCHRVVRTDGSLSGYRWGVERKRQLLALERAVAEPPVR